MARTPIHPGEILSDELKEIGLSAKKLANVIEVPPNRLYQILAKKRSNDGGHGTAPQPIFRHVGGFLDEPPEHL
jgi:hypothetical protein